MKVRVALGAIIGIVAAAALACGGDASDGTSGHDMNDMQGMNDTSATATAADVTVEVKAQALRYVPDQISIPMGKTVKVRLVNGDPTEHDLMVEGLSVEVVGDTSMAGGHMSGSSDTLAVHTLANGTAEVVVRTGQPGTYVFYCTIQGHRSAGMEGTLVVR